MITRIRSWWDHLGYCWNGGRDEFRTFGIRPWRGAPFFWFVIDRDSAVVQSEKHRATCEECHRGAPVSRSTRKPAT